MLSRGFSRGKAWIRNLISRRRKELELTQEVDAYAALLADEHRARGLDPAAARRAAAIELGGREQVRENTRAARAGFGVETLMRDLRFAARQLRRQPGFTLVVLLTLALGIGANTALFSLVRGVLLRPLPYPGADRVVMAGMRFAPQNSPMGNLSAADYLDWKSHSRAFAPLGAFGRQQVNLIGIETPQRLAGARADAGFFAALGRSPLRGREFTSADDGPSATPVALLSETLWRTVFHANEGVLGRPIQLGSGPVTVVGVLPADFDFPAHTQIWTNLRLAPPARRGPFFLHGIARLRPGVTLDQAREESNRIGRAIESANPGVYTHLSLPLLPLRQVVVGDTRRPLLVLMGAVGLLLLIAIVNVANLLLARVRVRAPEMAVRIALGAGRGRLLRQLLTESLLLSLVGAGLGIGLAAAALAWIKRVNPAQWPQLDQVRLDAPVLAFTAAVALLAGLLFGVVPAHLASDGAVAPRLKSHRRHGWGSRALVAVEFALALMLLAGAGLLLRSYARLQQVDAGVHQPPQRIFTSVLSLNGARYDSLPNGDDPPAGLAFYRQLLAQVQALPGVKAAAISDSLPPDMEFDDDTFTLQGMPWSSADFPSVPDVSVSPGYFQTLGVPLLAGRGFDAGDAAKAPPVVLISQAVARHHFPRGGAIGAYLKQSEPDLHGSPFMRIVGVVGDADYEGLVGSPLESIYLPLEQDFNRDAILSVRSALPAATLMPSIVAVAHHLDPDTVVQPPRRLDELLARDRASTRWQAELLGAFAALALLLAMTGIYGVVSSAVTQQNQVIGIRIALGASPAATVRAFLLQSAQLALAGIAAGFLGAWMLARVLSGMLFQVEDHDPAVLASVSLVLLAVGLLAALVPACRATRVDPVIALRTQ